MVKYLPELAWENIEVKKVKSYKADSADWQVKVSFKNTGKLPTALKQAHLVKIVADDKVVLNFTTQGSTDGKPVYKVIGEAKPAGGRGEGRGRFMDGERAAQITPVSKNVPDTEGGAVTASLFNIRVYKGAEISGKASVFSTRGGVLKDKGFSIK